MKKVGPGVKAVPKFRTFMVNNGSVDNARKLKKQALIGPPNKLGMEAIRTGLEGRKNNYDYLQS